MGMTMKGVKATLAMLDRAEAGMEEAMIEAFAYVGEYVVAGIRKGDMSTWNDQTHNLRSSIGYGVAKNGHIVLESSFGVVSGGAEGSTTGKGLLEKLTTDYSKYRYVLVVVAGMDYAVYVEAMENKVVLAGGQLWAENNVTKILQSRVDAVLKQFNG